MAPVVGSLVAVAPVREPHVVARAVLLVISPLPVGPVFIVLCWPALSSFLATEAWWPRGHLVRWHSRHRPCSVMEPTPDVLAGFDNLSRVCNWARLPGETGDRATPRGALFSHLGATENEHWNVVATISPADFGTLLQAWRIGEGEASTAPTPTQLSQARLVWRGCRIAAGLIATAHQQAQQAQAAAEAAALAAQTPAANAGQPQAGGGAGGGAVAARRMKINPTISQIDDSEFEQLGEAALAAARGRWEASYGVGTRPAFARECTVAQLSALHASVATGQPPAPDFGIGGAARPSHSSQSQSSLEHVQSGRTRSSSGAHRPSRRGDAAGMLRRIRDRMRNVGHYGFRAPS